MTKILMISYSWLPCGSVGIIRMARFAKYLVRFGYGVSVLTSTRQSGNISWDIEEPELTKVKVYRIGSGEKQSFYSYLRQKINPQLEIDWFYSVKKKLDALLKDIKCDVIISSSPPESAHFIAKAIKEKTRKPWIADLRDLWSHDHYRSFGLLRRAILSFEEESILKKADRILSVSNGWGQFLKKRYGDKVVVITNSFDEDWFNAPIYKEKDKSRPCAQGRDKFMISYLGKLNARHQDISMFLRSIKDLVDKVEVSQDRLEANFYISGYGKPDIKRMANRLGLNSVVNEYEPVSLSKAIRIMRNSNLLLLVGWRGVSADAWRPQKVYEYLGSGIPILLINGSNNGELAQFITETGSGRLVKDIPSIEEEILRNYNSFIENKPNQINQNKELLDEYKAVNITKKLSSLIEEVKR